ncbi:hypothetical protein OG806_49230 [Streptomyces sp. NBC_00882]|uniref:hypothetical protein n=1 Tax=Streptomyces TaxID=1883 RepID=UPI003866343B|nr:hypothetical protein OG806_49230 [Streptomyces sp. NBC_00882]WSZ63794.1 hypothetical protein OH824_48505 [Streptomyces canus]
MAGSGAAYGTFTDLPGDWYREHNEILEAVAGAMSDMDDILFHAWARTRLAPTATTAR